MKYNTLIFTILLCIYGPGKPGLEAQHPHQKPQHPHHRIHAKIDHRTASVYVHDTVEFYGSQAHGADPLVFHLNKNLCLAECGEGWIAEMIGAGEENTNRYRLTGAGKGSGRVRIPLYYHGRIGGEIKTGSADYARGFSETDGIISPDGIYLAGSTRWVPIFEGSTLFTFELTTEVDEPWQVVSQGTREMNLSSGGRRRVRHSSPDPMDEVFLVAGKWREYSRQAGKVLVQVFLRSPDNELANRYLGATGHYLDLYTRLIGDYPYGKFALVENFWETGYGMPSFTLLGPRVIRFPWILHSSYPHELLHNYWGNSVFVDYSGGNWCEGITVYMADHLIKEQQGLAREYRRNTLQKFTDYVNPANDFPPSQFTSRNNPSEEAIGYGKVMMFNNMLRDELGDDIFLKGYGDFYASNRFRHASFEDIRSSFEKVSGRDLKHVFDQWINRKGAPSLRLHDVRVAREGNRYELSWALKQVQEGGLFNLKVPVAVYLEGREDVHMFRIDLSEAGSRYDRTFDTRPLKISIDPQFNLMRTLDRSEVPTTLSQLFGGEHLFVILPRQCEMPEAYSELATFWERTQGTQGKRVSILFDDQIEQLPAEAPVWVLGDGNRFAEKARPGPDYLGQLSSEDQETIFTLTGRNTLVFTMPNPANPDQTVGFIGTGRPEALGGLARKLLHYGSYGYLGFEGTAPDNVLKGVFPVLNSALDYMIPYPDHPGISQALPVRKALGRH